MSQVNEEIPETVKRAISAGLTELTNEHMHVIASLFIAFSLLSTLSSLCVVLAFIRLGQAWRYASVFSQSFLDFVSSLAILVGAVLYSIDSVGSDTGTSEIPPGVCKLIGCITLVALSASFLTSLVYALELHYTVITGKGQHKSTWVKCVILLSIIVPSAVTCIFYSWGGFDISPWSGTEEGSLCTWCLPLLQVVVANVNWFGPGVYFVITIMFVMVANCIVYWRTCSVFSFRLHRVFGVYTDRERSLEKRLKMKVSGYWASSIMCWGLFISAFFLSTAGTHLHKTNWVVFLGFLSALSSLHGFVNSFVHGWRSRKLEPVVYRVKHFVKYSLCGLCSGRESLHRATGIAPRQIIGAPRRADRMSSASLLASATAPHASTSRHSVGGGSPNSYDSLLNSDSRKEYGTGGS
eukprot:Nk52_evm26s967 gene=Nk52_evmTU26s967